MRNDSATFSAVPLYLRLAKKKVGGKGARKVMRMIRAARKRFERESLIRKAPE